MELHRNLLLLLIGHISQSVVLASCPSDCKCITHDREYWGPDHVVVSCSDKGISAVPAGLPHQTKTLSLEKNQLISLDPSALLHLKSLRALYLKGNQFTKVDPNTLSVFQTLSKSWLRAIDLSENAWDCCNPDMKEFIQWLQLMKGPQPMTSTKKWVALIDAYKTLCSSPQSLKGKRLDELQITDIDSCHNT